MEFFLSMCACARKRAYAWEKEIETNWFAKQKAIIKNVIRIIVKFTAVLQKINMWKYKFIQKSLECALLSDSFKNQCLISFIYVLKTYNYIHTKCTRESIFDIIWNLWEMSRILTNRNKNYMQRINWCNFKCMLGI